VKASSQGHLSRSRRRPEAARRGEESRLLEALDAGGGHDSTSLGMFPLCARRGAPGSWEVRFCPTLSLGLPRGELGNQLAALM